MWNAVKFWLTCCVLLFLGAELLGWVAELGSGHPSGAWLILGGMGLAAASNAAHLPKLGSGLGGGVKRVANAAELPNPADTDQSPTAKEEQKPLTQPLSVAEQSAEDSISFKVRLPWR
jgi:hypothetical protein